MDLDFRLIAATGVPVAVGTGARARAYSGPATMLKPLGPDYGDNVRVGVSHDIVPVVPPPAAGGGGGGQ